MRGSEGYERLKTGADGRVSLTQQVFVGQAALRHRRRHRRHVRGEDVRLSHDERGRRRVEGREARGVALLLALVQLEDGDFGATMTRVPVAVLYTRRQNTTFSHFAQVDVYCARICANHRVSAQVSTFPLTSAATLNRRLG